MKTEHDPRHDEHHRQARIRQMELTSHKLMPGQVIVDAETPISTLLGSCVAVCLFDRHLGLAGMNHFLLPTLQKDRTQLEISLSGMAAMENLVNAMMKRGADKKRLLAKAFGGANMLNLGVDIPCGQRNIEFTREWLAAEKIPLVAMDLGGPHGRKIVADPKRGEVYCRRISNKQTVRHNILRVEVEYQRTLRDGADKSAIDFL